MEQTKQLSEVSALSLFFSARGTTFVEFRIEGDIKHLKNTNINEFRSTLCKNLGIKMTHINLVGVGEGSILLTWQMPNFVVSTLRCILETGKCEWLNKAGVVEVKIGKSETYVYARCGKLSFHVLPLWCCTCEPMLGCWEEGEANRNYSPKFFYKFPKED